MAQYDQSIPDAALKRRSYALAQEHSLLQEELDGDKVFPGRTNRGNQPKLNLNPNLRQSILPRIDESGRNYPAVRGRRGAMPKRATNAKINTPPFLFDASKLDEIRRDLFSNREEKTPEENENDRNWSDSRPPISPEVLNTAFSIPDNTTAKSVNNMDNLKQTFNNNRNMYTDPNINFQRVKEGKRFNETQPTSVSSNMSDPECSAGYERFTIETNKPASNETTPAENFPSYPGYSQPYQETHFNVLNPNAYPNGIKERNKIDNNKNNSLDSYEKTFSGLVDIVKYADSMLAKSEKVDHRFYYPAQLAVDRKKPDIRKKKIVYPDMFQSAEYDRNENLSQSLPHINHETNGANIFNISADENIFSDPEGVPLKALPRTRSKIYRKYLQRKTEISKSQGELQIPKVWSSVKSSPSVSSLKSYPSQYLSYLDPTAEAINPAIKSFYDPPPNHPPSPPPATTPSTVSRHSLRSTGNDNGQRDCSSPLHFGDTDISSDEEVMGTSCRVPKAKQQRNDGQFEFSKDILSSSSPTQAHRNTNTPHDDKALSGAKKPLNRLKSETSSKSVTTPVNKCVSFRDKCCPCCGLKQCQCKRKGSDNIGYSSTESDSREHSTKGGSKNHHNDKAHKQKRKQQKESSATRNHVKNARSGNSTSGDTESDVDVNTSDSSEMNKKTMSNQPDLTNFTQSSMENKTSNSQNNSSNKHKYNNSDNLTAMQLSNLQNKSEWNTDTNKRITGRRTQSPLNRKQKTSVSVRSNSESSIQDADARRKSVRSVTSKDLEGGLFIRTKTYQLRFYILMFFSIVAMMQCVIWGTWGPIIESSKYAFSSWTSGTISLLNAWGPIDVIVFIVPVTYMNQKYGLRVGLLLVTSLMCAGTLLRCIPAEQLGFTILANLCAIVNGVAGCLTLSLPAMIAATWFPPNERTTATAVAGLFSQVGSAVMYLEPLLVRSPPSLGENGCASFSRDDINSRNTRSLSPDIAISLDRYRRQTSNESSVGTTESRDDLTRYTTMEYDLSPNDVRGDILILMYIHAAIAALLFIAALIYFPAKPKLPPSKSSAVDRLDYFASLKVLFLNGHFMLLLITYIFSVGIPLVWVGVMNFNLCCIGVRQDQGMYIAIFAISLSCLSAFIAARITDAIYGHLKMTIIVLLSLSSICFLWFLCNSTGVIPATLAQLYLSIGGGVAFQYATVPLLIELAVELSYPCPESVVGAVLTGSFNLISGLFLLLFLIPSQCYLWVNYLLVACTSLTIIPLCFVDETHRRMADDQTTAEQGEENYSYTTQTEDVFDDSTLPVGSKPPARGDLSV